MARFEGKTVLITGAGGGLGQQLAQDFAAEGACVVANYAASAQATLKLVDEITRAGGRAIACQADIAVAADVNRMVATAMDTYGRIDVLINNAGLSLDAPFMEMSEAAWDRVMGVNLKGPFLLSQAVARHMLAAESGRIVNISANTAIQARVGNANYAASKAGLNMLTQSMAWELGPNITVNTLALGAMDSPLLQQLFSPEQLQALTDQVALKRMGTYAEASAFVMMLASDTVGFMTGQTIAFDGGKVMR